MENELKTIETADLSSIVLPSQSQVGDKNTQIGKADTVNIYNYTAERQTAADKPNPMTFRFGVSFAVKDIEIEVTTEEGISKVFWGDYCTYTKCEADDWTTATKNQIMKWYVQGKKESFVVVVEDKRIEHIKTLFADIEEKLAEDKELTLEEEVRYENLGRLIRLFDSERRAKEKAVIVYLKDNLFHAYSHVGFYGELLDMIKEILDFPYRRGIGRDAGYYETFKSFDVYTGAVKKEYKGDFVVDLLVSDVEVANERDGLLQFPGNFVCDWGVEMAKKIAVQYYVQYIGRQIIDHERPILESAEYLNAWNTGIHSWCIGPH